MKASRYLLFFKCQFQQNRASKLKSLTTFPQAAKWQVLFSRALLRNLNWSDQTGVHFFRAAQAHRASIVALLPQFSTLVPQFSTFYTFLSYFITEGLDFFSLPLTMSRHMITTCPCASTFGIFITIDRTCSAFNERIQLCPLRSQFTEVTAMTTILLRKKYISSEESGRSKMDFIGSQLTKLTILLVQTFRG